MPFMNAGPSLGKEEAVPIACGGKNSLLGSPLGLRPDWLALKVFHSDCLRMGGRVVDRARLESVFTFIGNEGSNPSPSGAF